MDGTRAAPVSRAGRTYPPERERKRSVFWQSGRIDITFLALVLILLTIGLVMLFSASYPYAYANRNGDSFYFIVRQGGFAMLGLAAMAFLSRVDYHFYCSAKIAWALYITALLLLVAVRILPATDGFHRWIYIGPLSIQPSEIAKFAVVVLLTSMISRGHDRMQDARFSVVKLGAVILAPCALIFLEPHLSATVITFLMGFVMLIVGGIKMRWVGAGGFALAGIIGVAAAFGAIGYAASRLKYWIDPWSEPQGKGYQTIQSLYAIGSGGLLGRGIGQSQQKYLWMPEPQNDFVFAVVCEELGLVGAMIIIALFALLVWRGFIVAMHSPDRFGTLLAVGLTFQVGLQAAINIMVVTNTIPNTGISLPFFSYGGTALTMLLAEMGVVLSVSRASRLEKR